MANIKKFLERKAFTVRLTVEDYDRALLRLKQQKHKNINDYVVKLVQEDLLFADLQYKKQAIKKNKDVNDE